MKDWNKPIISNSISLTEVNSILENQCSFLIIKNFLNKSECESIIKFLKEKKLIKKFEYNFDNNHAPEALHYMTTHYLFEENPNKSEYEIAAINGIRQFNEIVESIGFNPFDKIEKEFLRSGIKIKTALEGKQEYSRVIIRSLYEGALLHADYAPFLDIDWSIKNIDSELAWNIFLTEPEVDGECVVYNKQWEKEDDQFIIKDTYGYSLDLVKNSESSRYRPCIGDFVIFNSRNFHKVEKSQGSIDRISMGGHFGRSLSNQKELLSWV